MYILHSTFGIFGDAIGILQNSEKKQAVTSCYTKYSHKKMWKHVPKNFSWNHLCDLLYKNGWTAIVSIPSTMENIGKLTILKIQLNKKNLFLLLTIQATMRIQPYFSEEKKRWDCLQIRIDWGCVYSSSLSFTKKFLMFNNVSIACVFSFAVFFFFNCSLAPSSVKPHSLV